MNPFAEDSGDHEQLGSSRNVEETRTSVLSTTTASASSSSSSKKNYGNPFAAEDAGGGSPPTATASYKRKQPVAVGSAITDNPTAKNPFYEADLRPSPSRNPFQAPSASESAKNPFAGGAGAGGDQREAGTQQHASAVRSTDTTTQSFKLTVLEHRETALKHLSVGDNLALVIVQNPATGETIVSRRDMTAFNRSDGSITLKDPADTVFLDPSSTYALLMLRGSKTQQKDAVFFISPQDATLKARGPLSVLSGVTTVCWCSREGDYWALIGSASGVVQTARFSHNGLVELNPFCSSSGSSPIVAIASTASVALVLDSMGRFQFVDWNGQKIAEGTLSLGGKSGKLEVVSAVADEESDFWVLSNHGLHLLGISYAERNLDSSNVLPGIRNDLVYEQENCFALSCSRLFVLALSRHSTSKQSNTVSTKLAAVSKITLRTLSNLEKPKVTIHGAPALGFARDDVRGKVYLYSEKGVCLVEVTDEAKGAWKEYLARAQERNNELDFVRALEYCSSKRERDQTRVAQADWNLAQRRYVQAAELYSEVSGSVKSFEEISLALSLAVPGTSASPKEIREKKRALRVFLTGKLSKVNDEKKTLQTMLSTWICEAFLDELDQYPPVNSSTRTQKDVEEEQDTVSAFCAFLGSHSPALDPAKEVVFHLILSHGRVDVLLVYAHLTKDYNRVVVHHMHRNAPQEAVRALREYAEEDLESACALIYKHSPALIILCPEALTEAWMALPSLEPVRLVPALSRLDENDTIREWGLRYLEHCVNTLGIREEAIHNLLLASYSRDEVKLFQFIKRETSQPGGFCFDPGFALRMCAERSPRSHIVLLEALDMPEAACVTALELGMHEVAQRVATEQSVTRGNDELAKRLWLFCCKDALKDPESPTKNALDVLRASAGILSVEDLLQLLPDAVKMDELRDEVCVALERYNTEIERLRGEMDENAESAQALRRDAVEEKRRFDVIRASKRCDTCSKRIFADAHTSSSQSPLHTLASGVDEFYVFPCTHIFHSNCLYEQVIARLPSDGADRLARLAVSDSEEDQALLEEIVGAACPLCGELMIQSVAQPLVFARDEGEARSWE